MKVIDKLSKRKTCYVIADPRDNSITFSKSLAMRLKLLKRDTTKVFVFAIPDLQEFGFVLNPPLGEGIQMGEVQYNTRHKCVGFECLNPSVNLILYNYLPNAPIDAAVKLSVRVEKSIKVEGCQEPVFVIERPNDKVYISQHQEA